MQQQQYQQQQLLLRHLLLLEQGASPHLPADWQGSGPVALQLHLLPQPLPLCWVMWAASLLLTAPAPLQSSK